jgi:hypothetical protein
MGRIRLGGAWSAPAFIVVTEDSPMRRLGPFDSGPSHIPAMARFFLVPVSEKLNVELRLAGHENAPQRAVTVCVCTFHEGAARCRWIVN